jgi:drug/metabolite transporter (DMT)-like permease
MSTPIPYFGEILSFVTALIWASSVILFKKSGETVSPLALNLFKNGLAFVLLIPTLLFMGVQFFPQISLNTYGLALLGGLLSIGLADTTFFRSLNTLGAGRFAVVDSLYSPSIILFAFVFIGERLSIVQWVGVAGVVSAVFIANYEPSQEPLERKRLFRGTLWGLLSIVLMAAGLTVIKPVLEAQHLLWVTFWRVVGGLGTMIVLFALHPGRKRVLATLANRKGWGYTLSGSFFGAYFVTMIWLGGMKYTTLSIASSLNQTSTVITFILAAVFLKEALTKKHFAAILMAFAGALAVTFG